MPKYGKFDIIHYVKTDKKRKILFSIFSCSVILLLISFLVVKVFANPNSSSSNYASSFELTSPKDINIRVNTQITLNENIFKISPSNYNMGMEYSTYTAKSNENYYNFNFENKTFFASKIGSYYISFVVKKSNKLYISQTLKITVQSPDEFFDIKQINDNFKVGQTLSITEIFETNSLFSYSFSTEDNSILSINNGILSCNKIGSTNIIVKVDRSYISYSLVFPINITNTEKGDTTNLNGSDNQGNNNPKDENNSNDNQNENNNTEDKSDENQNGNQQENPTDPEKPNPPIEDDKDPNSGSTDNEKDEDNSGSGNDNKGDDTEKEEDNTDKDDDAGNKDHDTENEQDENKDNENEEDETKPQYSIKFFNRTLKLGQNALNFCIYENDKISEFQEISVEVLENKEYVEIFKIMQPTIYINALKTGIIKLKITCLQDPTITFIEEFVIE